MIPLNLHQLHPWPVYRLTEARRDEAGREDAAGAMEGEFREQLRSARELAGKSGN
jgi:hypothetical protein